MAAEEDNPTGDVAEPRYKGVRKTTRNRYTVGIRGPHMKRRLWLGTFNKAEDAARAYDAMAIELRGVKAKTNFPHPAAAAIPRRSSTFESSSSAVSVSSTSFQVAENEKGLGFDLNMPPPLED